MAMGNMRRNVVKIGRVDMIADRQTDIHIDTHTHTRTHARTHAHTHKQRDRHAHHNTPLLNRGRSRLKNGVVNRQVCSVLAYSVAVKCLAQSGFFAARGCITTCCLLRIGRCCKQNLLLFIQPRWQLRRTFFSYD